MKYHANTTVRLRANSELLYIDSIDESAATAYCRRFGDEGPVGQPEAYLLDSLRENVVRSSVRVEQPAAPSVARRFRCKVGLHEWSARNFPARPVLGSMEGRVCRYCGETRLAELCTEAEGRR